MYESAHFISSKTVSAYSQFPMPEHYPDYPSHRQIFQYLNEFADHYGLREGMEFGAEVTAVTKNLDNTWRVTRSDGATSDHSAVIVCTGAQWHPNLPEIPGEFTGEVIHSRDYRSAQSLIGKRVLVLGAGNSGCDIACDAARSAAEAHCRCAEATGSFRNTSSTNQWMSSPPADPSYHFGSSRRSLRKC